MSDKNELQIRNFATTNSAAMQACQYVLFTDYETQRLRADAWKEIAERLYKSAMCDCCDDGGLGCDRCLQTVQAYTKLKAFDDLKRREGSGE